MKDNIKRRAFLRNIAVTGAGIAFTGLLNSCSKDSFIIRPKGQADFETLLNKKGVDELLIGAYAAVDGTINTNAGMAWASSISNWVWGSVASDDARKGSGYNDQPDINPIEYFYVDAFNSYVLSHWRTYYDAVLRANDVLRALPKVTDMTDSEKILVEAQAKFLRAHFYFELTMVHGKVPYIDENTADPGVVPNDHLVYPEMENDMKFASENLPGRWDDKGRVTKWAAKTYLARMFLFEQKFADAMPLLQDVYSNGGFTLMPSYEDNYRIKFLNNAESIWEIQYAVNDGGNGSPNANQGDGLAFPYGGLGLGVQGAFFQATNSMVSAFRVTSSGLPYVEDIYSVDDILPYDHEGKSVPYKLPVDPRLDWTVGRPGIPFLNFGIIHPGDKAVVDPKDFGPYNYKKNMFWKGEEAFVTSSGWMTALNANNFRVFRLGHVILWLAECEAEVGSLNNATNLVNEIRNRAKGSNIVRFDDGTPAANYKVEPYPKIFPTKEYARKAIRKELRIEFGMEGMRFFDLVRWGTVSEVMNNYMKVEGSIMPPLNGRTFEKGKNEIWPIPQNEIDLSKKDGKSVLVQNPGY